MHNETRIKHTTMGATTNNESTATEPSPEVTMVNQFNCQIFALDSNVSNPEKSVNLALRLSYLSNVSSRGNNHIL